MRRYGRTSSSILSRQCQLKEYSFIFLWSNDINSFITAESIEHPSLRANGGAMRLLRRFQRNLVRCSLDFVIIGQASNNCESKRI